MKFFLNISRTIALAGAVSVAAAPIFSTQVLADAPAEASIVTTPYMALPDGADEGFRKLVETLTASGADQTKIDAAQSFVEFLAANPSLIGKEIPAMTDSEIDSLSRGLSEGKTALETLSDVTDVLLEQEWLTEVNPVLAQNIARECKRRTLDGQDMYAASAQILQDPDSFVGDPVNLMEDVGESIRECVENLDAYSRLAAEELRALEQFIQAKEDELEKAKADGDQAEIDRIEAEIAAAKERQEEIKKGLDIAALLKLVAGIAGMVAGIAAVVASGGSCVPCYGQIAAGAVAAGDAINKLEDKETRTVPGQARRAGINSEGEPSEDDRNQEEARIEADPNLNIVAPENPGGNYIVTQDKNNGNVVVVQIAPPLKFTLDLSSAVQGIPYDAGLLALNDAPKVKLTEVKDPLRILPTENSLILNATINNQPIKLTLIEKPVGGPVAIAVERQ